VVGCLVLLTLFSPGCARFSRNSEDQVRLESRQLTLRGKAALQQQRWQEAEKVLSRAVEIEPQSVQAHAQYGKTLWNLNNHQDALVHMREAIRLSGGDPQLMVQLGEMQLVENQLSAAAQSASIAVQARPHSAAAHALRAKVLDRQGNLPDALAGYHRALSLQPDFPEVQTKVAEIYQRMNRPQRSLAILARLHDRYPPGQVPQRVLQLQGLAMKSLGRYGDAIERFVQAGRQDTMTAELFYQLAESHWLAGDRGNAQLAIREALQLEPQHVAGLRLQQDLRQDQTNIATDKRSTEAR
jgi:tetratricopeptide (TPR) repeat protein